MQHGQRVRAGQRRGPAAARCMCNTVGRLITAQMPLPPACGPVNGDHIAPPARAPAGAGGKARLLDAPPWHVPVPRQGRDLAWPMPACPAATRYFRRSQKRTYGGRTHIRPAHRPAAGSRAQSAHTGRQRVRPSPW